MINNSREKNTIFENKLDINYIYSFKHEGILKFELGITFYNKDEYLRYSKKEYKLIKTGNCYYLSGPYNNLIYKIKSYFEGSIRCIGDNLGNPKFWLAYEYDKPLLWSLIDTNTIKTIIRNKLIVQYLWEPFILDDIINLLYKSLRARLYSAPIYEDLKFDIFVSNNTYKLRDNFKEFDSLYERKGVFVYPLNPVSNNKHYFVVLDEDNLLSIENQIILYKNLLSSKKSIYA